MHTLRHFAPVRQWSRRAFLTATAGVLSVPWLTARGAAAPPLPADELQRIAAALPGRAWARPRRPRRLLSFELNVNYGGHRSIPTATAAFRMMGEKTGAFSVTASQDPEIFRPDRLREFDGVFFNNNVGNLFTDPELRESLADFVFSGGGLMGVHGATVAFTQWPGAVEDWPEFGLMIGARGANHRENTERVVMKIEEPGHPLTRALPGSHFEYRDEYFRVHEPYSRQRLRVLLSMDLTRMEPAQGPAYGQVLRADQDYAVAWARQYGRGRCFYCTIAHNPYVFWEPVLLSFYLAAAQFILGDYPAPVTPSARLTPAVRAQEKLGWRLGLAGGTEASVLQALDTAAAAGLLHLSAGARQPLSATTPRMFDDALNGEERRQLRFKLDATGTRLAAYHAPELPAGEAACRRLFAFARRMGCELIVVPSPSRGLAAAEACARQYEVQLAVRPTSANPLAEADQICRGRRPDIGIWWDAALGAARGATPQQVVQTLKERLLVVELAEAGPGPAEFLRRLHAARLQPALLALTPGAGLPRVLRECEATLTQLTS